MSKNFADEQHIGVDPFYMARQDDITPRMRSTLIDWLVEVQDKYRLKYITLHLTVRIVDRYLTVRAVRRRHLQLLGVTAMFVAAKYEEIDPPKAAQFSYITDNTYTRAEILGMECQVLEALDFEVAKRVPVDFYDMLQRVNGCDERGRHVAEYVLDISLLDITCLQYTPSILASSALFLSNRALGRQEPWPMAVQLLSRHTQAELQPCIQHMELNLMNAPLDTLQGIRRKYQAPLYSRAADVFN